MDINIQSVLNNRKTEYSFDYPSPENAVIEYMKCCEAELGKVSEISVAYRENGERKVLNYDDISDYENRFNYSDKYSHALFSFICEGAYICVGINLDIGKVFIYNQSIKPELKPENNKYYKFEDGLIVKFDTANTKFYFLNNEKRWEEKASLSLRFANPDLFYERIDDIRESE